MENDVMELLESLYNMVTEAWGVPLGKDKCMLEREAVLNILDEIKAQMPVELAEAKRLVTARDEFIGNAKREAEAIRKAAEEHAKARVDEQEIVREAREKSAEMIANAEKRSRELRRAANEYVDEALHRAEETMSSSLDAISQSRKRFRSAAGTASRNVEVIQEETEDAE